MPLRTPADLPLPAATLVLGGARSGKSRFAEGLVAAEAARRGRPAVYLATAQARDPEMVARVQEHRQRRGPEWRTVEEPLALPEALAAAGGPVLVDCLTLWLSNLLDAGRDPAAATRGLVAALRARDGGPAVLVSNEVGLGIVPDNALARAFRDHAGRLHQEVAAVSGRVVFVAAGLPLLMKG